MRIMYYMDNYKKNFKFCVNMQHGKLKMVARHEFALLQSFLGFERII
jgi:hypothetical protein